MTGIQMMLKAAGLDPAAIMDQIELVKNELPKFASSIKIKVDSMESRLDSIESGMTILNQKIDAILEHLDVRVESPASSLEVMRLVNGKPNSAA